MSTATTEVPGYVAGTWNLDPVHSELAYSVKHLGLARSRGSFIAFSGQITTGENILDSTVSADIDVKSLSTGSGTRDEHLLGPDFFDADNYPTIAFRSRSIRQDGDAYLIDGELSWRGVTAPTSLRAEFNGIGTNPANGNATTLGVSAETTIKRRDFGVGGEGNAMIGEDVTIILEIEAPLAK